MDFDDHWEDMDLDEEFRDRRVCEIDEYAFIFTASMIILVLLWMAYMFARTAQSVGRM